MRLTRSDLAAVDLERLRPLAAEPDNFFALREHYRLLAYLSESVALPGHTIVDVGTHQGDSALALSYGGRFVESFDVVDKMAGRPRPGNVRYHHEDLFDPAVRERWRQTLLDSAVILVDVDPHEGTRELALVRWLEENRYAGLVVLDDVWFFKPMRDRCWSQIPGRYRADATALGHWSGTGIVSFGERVEVDGQADTSNWTLVTGYFDLTKKADASDAIRARPTRHYLDDHGGGTLGAEQNLVVYCDPALQEKVWSMRPAHLRDRTRVVPAEFEDFPLTRYRSRIIENRGGPWCAADPRNTASYYLFCMSRYAMVKRAIADDPFRSSHFAWVNVCVERMGFNNLVYLRDALAQQRDLFSTCFIDYVPRSILDDLPSYFGRQGCRTCAARCSMCSGFFTGAVRPMRAVCDRLEDEFLRCLKMGFGHADEQLYPLVYYQRPDLFDWYVGDYTEMITNYSHVRERPEQPVRNLIAHSLAAGDREVAARAAGILLRSHEAGYCSLGDEDLRVVRSVERRAPVQSGGAPDDPLLLSRLFERYGTDKLANGYAPAYAALFGPRRRQVESLLEVGVGTMVPDVHSSMVGFAAPHYAPGGSLRAWRDYFPNATVVGMDVQPDTQLAEDRVETVLADSRDPVACARALGDRVFDVVVDDGSHLEESQLLTLRNLYPRVRAGGLYVIEDVGPNSNLVGDPSIVRAVVGHDHFFPVGRERNLIVVLRAGW